MTTKRKVAPSTAMKRRILKRLEYNLDDLAVAFMLKFGLIIEHHPSLATMSMISIRSDGKDFTSEQHAYIAGWSHAYQRLAKIAEETR